MNQTSKFREQFNHIDSFEFLLVVTKLIYSKWDKKEYYWILLNNINVGIMELRNFFIGLLITVIYESIEYMVYLKSFSEGLINKDFYIGFIPF